MLWSVGLHNESDLASLLQRAGEAGIPTQDISSLQEAQVTHALLHSAPLTMMPSCEAGAQQGMHDGETMVESSIAAKLWG